MCAGLCGKHAVALLAAAADSITAERVMWLIRLPGVRKQKARCGVGACRVK